jgi:hypothetical protein
MKVWLAAALTLICTAVFGHDSEQWINDAKLVDPVSQLFCCGPTDCSVLAPGSVERVQGGYKVIIGGWAGNDPFFVGWVFVSWDRALPFSPDGNYHICITADETGAPIVRCFIVPPSSA